MTTTRRSYALVLLLLPLAGAGLRADEIELPPDVREVLQGHESQAAALQQRFEAEQQTLRERTIQHLQTLQDNYTRAAKLDEALAVRSEIRRLQALHRSVEANPRALVNMATRVGQVFYFQIVGDASGVVWGNDAYTTDSDLATAAVHAGVVAPGKSATVKVMICSGQSSYPGVTRNGVTSFSWGNYSLSFRVERADAAVSKVANPRAQPNPGTLDNFAGQVGQTLHFDVTGAVGGIVWGTDVYTTDSDLATAAVHAGVLRPGERGTVRVTILAGQGGYVGSTRNLVTTHPWHTGYPASFRVERG